MTTPAHHRSLLTSAFAALAAGLLVPLAARASAAAAAPGPSGAASADASNVTTLEVYTVSEDTTTSSTLPQRPVTGLYGFATPYQDVPRSVAQITPEQFDTDIISSVNVQ